jgi:hypothetical protein
MARDGDLASTVRKLRDHRQSEKIWKKSQKVSISFATWIFPKVCSPMVLTQSVLAAAQQGLVRSKVTIERQD